MLPALAIGAALGLLKGETVDKQREERERKLASETQRYSPWTHLQAQQIHEADPLGSALQYGVGGAQLGENIQDSEAKQKLMTAQSRWLNAGGNASAPAAASTTWGAYGPNSMASEPMGSQNYWGSLNRNLGVGNY